MAFIAIDATAIESGDPVTADLWTKTKDNFDDHETRLTSVEGGSNVAYAPYNYHVSGEYPATFTNAGLVRIPFDIDIDGARLLVFTAGSSGSTEINFLYKRGAGAWTTIFSTRPSVPDTDGDYSISTNQVLSVTQLLAGDLLRMDITAKQGGNPKGCLGILEFSKT